MRSILRRGLLGALAFALVGCPPSFDGLRRGAPDGSSPRTDAGPGVDGGGPGDSGTPLDGGGGDSGPRADGGPPGPCDIGVTCASCPLPWLLASVEDLPGGQECGGQVLRWSLSGREEICACAPLLAEGTMPRLPFAVGFSPPNRVVVASEDDRVVAIDGTTDRVLWDEPFGGQPVDIFPIEDLGGTAKVAVASRTRGISEIRNVYFFDAATGGTPLVEQTNGDLPVGLGVLSMTASPLNPTHFRALKTGSYAAADVDPWNDVLFASPPHTADRAGFFLKTLSSFYYDGKYRVAWSGTRTDLDPDLHQVFNYRSTVPRTDNRVPLGEDCEKGEDLLDYDVTCEFLHVVPHPFWDTDQLALCAYGGARRVVRIRTIDQVCVDILDQSELFDSARVSKLAIALESYWD